MLFYSSNRTNRNWFIQKMKSALKRWPICFTIPQKLWIQSRISGHIQFVNKWERKATRSGDSLDLTDTAEAIRVTIKAKAAHPKRKELN